MGIARFDKTEKSRPGHDTVWPDSPTRSKSLFERRQPLRKLVVMIDQGLISDVDGKTSDKPNKEVLLRSLLNNDLIDYYKYVVDTPPETAVQLNFNSKFPREPVYIGYAVLFSNHRDSIYTVTYAADEKRATHAGVVATDFARIARDDNSDATYTGKDAADKREADILALQTATQSLDADIYVTERPYLFTGSGIVAGRGVTVLNMEDAITAISLYLRAQQEFIIPSGHKKITYTYNRGLFYWVAARELLPEGWRWFSACVHSSSGAENDKLMYLGGATMSRMQRAIELRDEVHFAINMPTNNDTNDLALQNMDNVLLSLMGALDANARVAHYVLKMDDTKVKEAGWQRAGWIKKVKKEHAPLANLVAKNTKHYYVLMILSKLRNSIHGEPIHVMTKQDFNKKELIMGLPKEDENIVLASMEALGGIEKWGVKKLTENYNEVDPGKLVDKLVSEVATLLNDLMRETPVEKLDHLKGVALKSEPDPQKAYDPFSEWSRINIRWQLGL